MSKRTQKRKRIPQRTCVACRMVHPKRELVRIVRTPQGRVAVDETGKQSGRGAYLCPKSSCWERALSTGQLSRALRTDVTEEAQARLREYAADLQPEVGALMKGVEEDE